MTVYKPPKGTPWSWQTFTDGVKLRVANNGWIYKPFEKDYPEGWAAFRKACKVWREETKKIMAEAKATGESIDYESFSDWNNGPRRPKGTLGNPGIYPSAGPGPARRVYEPYSFRVAQIGTNAHNFDSTDAGAIRYDAFFITDLDNMYAADRQAFLDARAGRGKDAAGFARKYLRR